MNKKVIAAISAATMAAAVFTIAGTGSNRVLAEDTGRNVQASAVTEESVTGTVDTPDEATVRIDDGKVAMADSVDAAEDDGTYTVTFEGMEDSTGAAFRTDDYQAGEQIKAEDVPSYDSEEGFQGWTVSTDPSQNIYSTSQIEAMNVNEDTTFTAVFSSAN